MSDITLNLGTQGETNSINLAWVDENGVMQMVELKTEVGTQDKPRVVKIYLDGDFIALLENSKAYVREKQA